jgi:hypothetical protein
MSAVLDANRRMAELVLWLDEGARWFEHATAASRLVAPRGRTVEVTFNRAELEVFVTGLRGVSRSLMGLAQPVPPPLPAPPAAHRHLRVVR